MQEELNQQETLDTTDYRQIRLDKLNNMKADGFNPFEITSYPVSVKNAELKKLYEQHVRAFSPKRTAGTMSLPISTSFMIS